MLGRLLRVLWSMLLLNGGVVFRLFCFTCEQLRSGDSYRRRMPQDCKARSSMASMLLIPIRTILSCLCPLCQRRTRRAVSNSSKEAASRTNVVHLGKMDTNHNSTDPGADQGVRGFLVTLAATQLIDWGGRQGFSCVYQLRQVKIQVSREAPSQKGGSTNISSGLKAFLSVPYRRGRLPGGNGVASGH